MLANILSSFIFNPILSFIIHLFFLSISGLLKKLFCNSFDTLSFKLNIVIKISCNKILSGVFILLYLYSFTSSFFGIEEKK